MNDEQSSEHNEEITLEDFMEQFAASGGTIKDLIEYHIATNNPHLDIAVLRILWNWITVDGLDLLEGESNYSIDTFRLLRRIFKDLKTLFD